MILSDESLGYFHIVPTGLGICATVDHRDGQVRQHARTNATVMADVATHEAWRYIEPHRPESNRDARRVACPRLRGHVGCRTNEIR